MATKPPLSGGVGGKIDTGRLGGRTSPGSFAFHRKQSTLSSRDSMADINARYVAIIRQLRSVTGEALRQALEPVFEKSHVYVPVDKGNLKASGRVVISESNAGRISGYIIYGDASARYAPIVHERTDLQHKSPTRAKFLQFAMEEEFDNLLATLAMTYASEFRP